MDQYLPVITLMVLAVIFGVISALVSRLLAPRRPTPAKSAPYECGIVPRKDPPERFPVRFYLVAMIFIGLGQVMGRAFDAIPNPVVAYSVDVLGSLTGIVLFGLMSLFRAPPVLWFAIGTAIGSASAHHGLVDLFDRVSRHVTELFLGGRHRARRWLDVPSTDGGVFFGARANARPRFQGGVDASHNCVYCR